MEMAEHKELYKNTFKRTHVVLVILFSILTLGVYLGYWFLNRRKSIADLGGEKVVPFKWWWFFTIFLVCSFFFTYLGDIFLTPYGVAVFSSVNLILSYYFLGLLYYSVFRLKAVLEDYYQETLFRPWLLVLFHVWYLQFIINRMEGAEVEKKKPVLSQVLEK
ncbi:DUF4234 domain-containing protein [Bacillaceae bacterium Marseille-Q3522]|nr:DUF4234 domain-containing protein [Bacillaceae bacterium Marseille-Q3522]